MDAGTGELTRTAGVTQTCSRFSIGWRRGRRLARKLQVLQAAAVAGRSGFNGAAAGGRSGAAICSEELARPRCAAAAASQMAGEEALAMAREGEARYEFMNTMRA